ncbi:MAG: hypothetical protein RBS73_03720 [Prolixibacteraceae bacterium]|jgi:hypothetical protein|nr:hypothetical protein [Prolixibacteraceae bacterium]
MEQNLLLTFTSSIQFGIFGAIIFIIFGWVDNKEWVTDIGRFIFIALGIYALWILLSGQVQVPETSGNVTSRELRVISFFKGIVLCSGICLVSLFLKWMKICYYRFVTLICVVFSLFLFFSVYSLLKM